MSTDPIPATLTAHPASHARLTWTFDMPINESSMLPAKRGEAKLFLKYELANPSELFRTMKSWTRPRSRWPGDYPPAQLAKHVQAVWFDEHDKTLAMGIIEESRTSVKYVALKETFEVSIYLATLIGFMRYHSKFGSSKDFVLYGLKFSIMF